MLGIEQSKIVAAKHAASVAQTTSEKKKSNSGQHTYGNVRIIRVLQFLGDEPVPIDTHLDEIAKEQLARVAAQKTRPLTELAARLQHVNHDHTYGCSSQEGKD